MKFIKQYGAWRTGTNYLRALLELNFLNIKVLVHQFRSKHQTPVTIHFKNRCDQVCFETDETHLSENERYLLMTGHEYVKSLILIKSPYSWILSYFDYVQRLKQEGNKKHLKILPVKLSSSKLSERNICSLVAHWNNYYCYCLKFCKFYPEDSLTIRYEDLMENFEATLAQISHKFGLAKKKESYVNEELIVDPGCKKSPEYFNREYYSYKRYMERFSEEQKAMIAENVDPKLLKVFNYKFEEID